MRKTAWPARASDNSSRQRPVHIVDLNDFRGQDGFLIVIRYNNSITDPDNLTLEQLRLTRADLSTVKEKVTDIEHHVIQLRMSDAKRADDDAHMYRRFRNYDLRLERIEKRLSVRDEP
jgi:hypothetical protein